MERDKIDLWLLVGSRGARSFAGGILTVIISLYYHSVYRSLLADGFLLGAGALGVPILAYTIGSYADRYGRKKLLLLTLFFLPLSLVLILLSSNFFILLLSAALGGLGIAGGLVGGGVGASVVPMQVALLAEKTNSNNRTLVFSLFTMMSSITGSMGALSAGLANYHTLFYVTLAFSTFSLLIAIPIKENFKPAEKGKKRSGRKQADLDERDGGSVESKRKENTSIIRKFFATGSLNGAAQGFIIPFLPIILHLHLGMSQGLIADLYAVGGFSSAFTMLTTNYLTNKLGFVRFIMSSRAVASIFLLYFPFATTALLASLAYILFTTLRAMSLPAQASLMMTLVSEETRAYASGANQAARLLPMSGGSALSGVIQDFFNYIIPFEIAFLLNAANIYLYFRFFGKMPEANKAGTLTKETESAVGEEKG